MAKIDFYLIKDRINFKLPVPPQEFVLQTGNLNQSVNIHSVGEINMPGKGRLATISWDSFFPSQAYSFSRNKSITDPWKMVDIVNSLKESNEPFRLIVTDTKINDLFLIDDFDYGMRDGTKDVYYTLILKQYKKLNYSNSSGGIDNPITTGNKPRTTKPAPKKDTTRTYKIKRGDTLWGIAKKYYGNGSKYKTIYNANKNIIKNPNKIQVGWVIKIP